MWGNIQGAMNNAIQKAKKLQSDLELQLDTAVGVDDSNKADPEGVIGNAIQDAKKLQSELELQLNTTAVGDDENNEVDLKSVTDAIQNSKNLQSELELQLDTTAVCVDESIKADTDTESKSQTVTPEGHTTEGWQDELDTLAIDDDVVDEEFTAEKEAVTVSEKVDIVEESNLIADSGVITSNDVEGNTGNTPLIGQETFAERRSLHESAAMPNIQPIQTPEIIPDYSTISNDVDGNGIQEQQLQAGDIIATDQTENILLEKSVISSHEIESIQPGISQSATIQPEIIQPETIQPEIIQPEIVEQEIIPTE
eukprot:CAMPEP_0119038964 /NCGR_PEP_ID=MMETSP1177-20130426/8194_1 /TAXON_ID=2985 /ORGANISM="Ochromonas sp, Strain CCMP1899" /LENGTH=310 /DNA_ID=CAMNT_0007002231 /DNA_START=32 /DNA_END=961 /DNA_ORIENTATION=+